MAGTELVDLTQMGGMGVLCAGMVACWKRIKVKDSAINDLQNKIIELTERSILATESTAHTLTTLIDQFKLIVHHNTKYTSVQEHQELEQKLCETQKIRPV